jgi:hypothetical protein
MMIAGLGMIVVLPGAATAAEPTTVQSLLAQEFAVVGAFTNAAGGGLYLQKKDRLFFCLVTETPQSFAVTTRYCKPVE